MSRVRQWMERPNSSEMVSYQCVLVWSTCCYRDMAMGGGPPDGARVFHHRTDDLLIVQNPISDGKTSPPVWEMYENSQSLCRFIIWSTWVEQVTVYQVSTQDNGRYWHNALAFWTVEVIGIVGYAYRFLRRTSRFSSTMKPGTLTKGFF